MEAGAKLVLNGRHPLLETHYKIIPNTVKFPIHFNGLFAHSMPDLAFPSNYNDWVESFISPIYPMLFSHPSHNYSIPN